MRCVDCFTTSSPLFDIVENNSRELTRYTNAPQDVDKLLELCHKHENKQPPHSPPYLPSHPRRAFFYTY